MRRDQPSWIIILALSVGVLTVMGLAGGWWPRTFSENEVREMVREESRTTDTGITLTGSSRITWGQPSPYSAWTQERWDDAGHWETRFHCAYSKLTIEHDGGNSARLACDARKDGGR